jgi:hypothetical protein
MADLKKAKESPITFPASIETPSYIKKSIENPSSITGQLPPTPNRPPKKT